MYTLYYLADSCSLATHTIMKTLGLTPTLKSIQHMDNFETINPAKMVPALATDERLLTEGAALILYLLERHQSFMLPTEEDARQRVIENMMLANASMHPAYGRLFFAAQNIADESAKKAFFKTANQEINKLWQVIESKIASGPYLSGEQISPADILLAVYSRWGQFFPVDIEVGPKAQRMIDHVLQYPAFKQALEEQNNDIARYAVEKSA